MDAEAEFWENHGMDELISAQKVGKSYGAVRALEALDLRLGRGEILGLLGPNGAGKTTAIHIFAGLMTPSEGSVRVLGLSPVTARHRIAERMNFSSAYVQLPSNLKVSENMRIFARLYGVKDARRIDELLTLFDISHLKNRVTGSLSSGEKTRLGLAKCLLNEPELLLLDEPTASLDPEMADKVRGTLRAVQKEKRLGILYTSHNMPEVEALCDRVLFLHEGRTVAEGTPAEVMRRLESGSLEEVFIKIVRQSGFVWKTPR
jgi:ABC-2 type transport system ATP-binding protein